MNIITYSLKQKNGKSDKYYNDIRKLTDIIFNRYKKEFKILLNDYQIFIMENYPEENCSEHELILDILIAGVFWNIYILKAINFPFFIYLNLSFLLKLRNGFLFLKPIIDKLRGIYATFILVKKDNLKIKDAERSVKNMVKLIRWLKAAGEFKQDVRRLKIFKSFLKSKNNSDTDKIIYHVCKKSDWFIKEADQILKKYVCNVDKFIKQSGNTYKWREDVILAQRSKAEYYLNMIGAVLLYRAFNKDFSKTKQKVVLVPACMRPVDNNCQARNDEKYGYICVGCTIGCNINKIKKLGAQNLFGVYIVPHTSDFTYWLKTFAANKDIGVVGVTCVLNLITGGLEMQALNIPGQCVLLDYCGCKRHWHKKGIATDLYKKELLKVLGQ